MMNEFIPGGRPRASSESDILDEHVVQNVENHSLTLDRRHFTKSFGNRFPDQFNSDEDTASSEKGYSTLPHKSKRSKKPLFKSVKKIVDKFRRPSHSKLTTDDIDMNGGKGGFKTESEDSYHSEQGLTIKKTSDSTSRPLITRSQVVAVPWKVCPGTVGIYNHGNTCFMNAVLQCLSNTDAVTEFFITKQYTSKQDLKGKGGFSKKFSSSKSELTEQFALLLEHLWSRTYSSDTSSSFKTTVGKCNNQYKGSAQHDAQEFLLWLLDYINEELAVHSKKKKQFGKGNDTSDEALAEEALNNSSGCFVYNLFQALYRSSLHCPKCGKESNTFESYLCLSLPIPQKTKKPVFVTIVYLDGNPRQRIVGIEVNIQDTVRELRDTLADNMHVPVTQLVLCQIQDDGFRSTFSDDQPITDISDNDTIYALETLPIPESESTEESPYLQLIVVHTIRESAPIKYFRFSSPNVLKVSRDIDFRMLQKDILRHLGGIKDGLLSQKLDALFRLRVVDGTAGKVYLHQDVEMPLLTDVVDRALSMCRAEYGPQHIKLVAEWDPAVQARVVMSENNTIDEHSSYRRLHQSIQQPYKVSLENCLQLFTKEETLSGEDAWNCPHCHKNRQAATKTLGLWSVPNILVIHLKRFRQVGLRRNKLKTLVDFPIRGMDMSDHILHRNHMSGDPEIYDLYGVCNHYGDMQGGHYTAFCKNPLDEKWYEFDDSKVKPMSEAEVKTSSAYLLFYQKRGFSSHILEGLQNKTHWVFKLNPNLLTVSASDVENRRDKSSQNESLAIQTLNYEESGGLFSRQGSDRSDMSSKSEDKSHSLCTVVDKPPAHGGATGHVSSKLVHNSSSGHTVTPEVLQNALSLTSKSQNTIHKHVANSLQGQYKADTIDASLDVNLKVKLPPSSVLKPANLIVDSNEKPPSGRTKSLYDRQNAPKSVKAERTGSSPPELPAKTYLDNYSSSNVSKKIKDAQQKVPVDTRNFPVSKENRNGIEYLRQGTVQQNKYEELDSRLNGKEQTHRQGAVQQTRHDEVDSRYNVQDPSPQQSRRHISTNWSTPQPPRKNASSSSSLSSQSKTPFKRQNSIPARRSSSSTRNYTRLPSSRSEEDLTVQSNFQSQNNYYDSQGKGYDPVVPANKGVHDIINSYNTMSKRATSQNKPPTACSDRPSDKPTNGLSSDREVQNHRHSERSSRNDTYKRSVSYQNAKNNWEQNGQIDRQFVSKSNDDFYEEKRRQQTQRATQPQSQPKYSSEHSRTCHDEIFIDNRMPKSKTDDNISYNNTPGSRKPFCAPSHSDSSSFTEDNMKRYRPHKHFYVPPKARVKSFKKEKLYSPCKKESAV